MVLPRVEGERGCPLKSPSQVTVSPTRTVTQRGEYALPAAPPKRTVEAVV